MLRKTGSKRKEENESSRIMRSNCPKGHQKSSCPLHSEHALPSVVTINTEQQKEKMCQGVNPSVLLTSKQNGNKHNISIRTKVGIWMQRQCRQINSRFFYLMRRKKGKRITVVMPLVNIPHIHPLCFLYGNVPCMEMFPWIFKYASGWSCHFHCSSLSFLWMHMKSNSSLAECNYGNFWRFVGSSVTAVCHFYKRSRSLWRAKKRFSC